jgi:glycosyltransferase involved in cell wall biosynthesis
MVSSNSKELPVKDSIIMTVADREPAVLMSTLRWLGASDLTNTEVLIVDDCSTVPYDFMAPLLEPINGRMIRLEPYECFRVDGNYNNPAKAFNAGLAEAKGERLIILSSDVIVPPRVIEACRAFDPAELIYCPRVVDLGTCMEYCGPTRLFPMPWFLACSTEHAKRCGGWDENYLRGMCFEDNDFVGRLALTTGKVLYDFDAVVWHQSHYQPAYSQDPEVREANLRSRQYTMDKWLAIPFDNSDKIAFEMLRKRHETGHIMFEFRDFRERMPHLVAATKSPFVAVAA